MRVLKIVFLILLLFTVIWSANYFIKGEEVPRFSTIQSSMQFYDSFTETPTFLDVAIESIDKITSAFYKIKNEGNWFKKIIGGIEGIFRTISLPIELIIWLGGWLMQTVVNFTKFLLGNYIVLF